MTSVQLAAELRDRMAGVADVSSPFPKQVVVSIRAGMPPMVETAAVLAKIAKKTGIDIEVRRVSK